MRAIKRFFRAWQESRLRATYDELADGPGYWTKEDAIWLASMLNHPTGQKLMRRLSNMVIRGAVDATKRTLNPRYHCGIARGMALLKTSIDRDYVAGISLAGAQSGNTENADGELDEAELEKLLAQ